jgi:thiosulfate dehydrogenase [quinone] large subunit
MEALAGARNFLYCASAMGELTRVSFLLPMRLFCGWVLLSAGLSKLLGGWLSGPQLANNVAGWLRDGKPYSIYAPFLRGVVLPHAHFFAQLVSFGELLAGAALLAGLFSRAAAAGGLLLVGNFMLAKGDGFAANGTAPMVIMMLTMMLTGPGRTLGLDATLRGRIPRWLG